MALEGDAKAQEEMQEQMIAYLNLVWEEAYLRKMNLLPKKLWLVWKEEIDNVLATDFAKKAMVEHGFPFLLELVESLQSNTKSVPPIAQTRFSQCCTPKLTGAVDLSGN